MFIGFMKNIIEMFLFILNIPVTLLDLVFVGATIHA